MYSREQFALLSSCKAYSYEWRRCTTRCFKWRGGYGFFV